MIDDHTKAGKDFTAAVQAANMQSPKEEPDANEKATLTKLQGTKGKAFDDANVSAQTTAHEEAVALCKGYAGKGQTAPLKDLAQKTLPTLEHHLQFVEGMYLRPHGLIKMIYTFLADFLEIVATPARLQSLSDRHVGDLVSVLICHDDIITPVIFGLGGKFASDLRGLGCCVLRRRVHLAHFVDECAFAISGVEKVTHRQCLDGRFRDYSLLFFISPARLMDGLSHDW
jgi:Domain of unknown function (DUF4142)